MDDLKSGICWVTLNGSIRHRELLLFLQLVTLLVEGEQFVRYLTDSPLLDNAILSILIEIARKSEKYCLLNCP